MYLFERSKFSVFRFQDEQTDELYSKFVTKKKKIHLESLSRLQNLIDRSLDDVSSLEK